MNQNLIIINKYYSKLDYFHNNYIEIVGPVGTRKSWTKHRLDFFRS
ncbi:hypothetical protein P2R53_24945 [Priestia megaterium]|nr:hypothetical protein [Priestia megaterium]